MKQPKKSEIYLYFLDILYREIITLQQIVLMYQYEVIIIIPKTCNHPSVEITYEVACAINCLMLVEKNRQNGSVKKVQACEIEKDEWMVWRKDGTVRIDFNAVSMKVVKMAIDNVMRTFQTSRWQEYTEKIVDNFNKKNLKRVKGTNGKKLVYNATEY